MIQEITIRPALNGYIVGVGCQSLVYKHSNELIADLTAWFDSPWETEKRIRKDCYNLGHLWPNEKTTYNGPVCPETACPEPGPSTVLTGSSTN